MKTRLTFLIILLINSSIFSQNFYDSGIQSLNNKNIKEAEGFFKKGINDVKIKEKCLLALSLLATQNGNELESAKYAFDFISSASNPEPIFFASIYDESFIGKKGLKDENQIKVLKFLEDNLGKFESLEMAITYQLGISAKYENQIDKGNSYFKKFIGVSNWSVVGPFDNQMNSGYDKDYGVLENPSLESVFKSEFNADINWYIPSRTSLESYFVKENYIARKNNIIYAQSFLKSENEDEVLIKFGYTGTFKLWLNDKVIYHQNNEKNSPLDFFTVKVKLNKGYNRLLVQFGDYEVDYATFNLRLTDLKGKALDIENQASFEKYDKNNFEFQQIPNEAFHDLIDYSKDGKDPIAKIMLAKAYSNLNDFEEAERIIKKLLSDYQVNFLVLTEAITFYSKNGNATEQARLTSYFESIYPESYGVIAKNINGAFAEKDKRKFKTNLDLYKEKYNNKLVLEAYELLSLILDENVDKSYKVVLEMVKKYPKEPKMTIAEYNFLANIRGDKAGGIKVLEDYNKQFVDFEVVDALSKAYEANGSFKEAVNLYEVLNINEFSPIYAIRRMVNIYSKQTNYAKAIELSKTILLDRPTDYDTYYDIANLYKYGDNKKEALAYYEQALMHYPFSYKINEEIREIKEQKTTKELIGVIDETKIISDYEANYKPSIKKSIENVFNSKSNFLFKSNAQGVNYAVILKIIDESAIEDYQSLNFAPFSEFNCQINEAKIIKPSGQKLDAERNGYNVVFQNLEIGDYIYYNYTQNQTSKSETSKFFFENYGFSSYYPSYIDQYRLFAEKGVSIIDTLINNCSKPTITEVDGFVKYEWDIRDIEILKSETNSPKYYDISKNVQQSNTKSWDEISKWYRDLTVTQIEPDLTIKELVVELFPKGFTAYSDIEKAKVIYDFVCKNIQYSSIDFRQSGIIPQKASKVYFSRLGDCKDVSTLYASLAKAVGLDAQLVLINTSDNGESSTILPSSNFNHCIVKVNYEKYSDYLELTDSYLPYGYLYSYHKGSAILDIPANSKHKLDGIKKLGFNEGFKNEININSKLNISKDRELRMTNSVFLKGTVASDFTYNYINEDTEEQKKRLKNSVSNHFDSEIEVLVLNLIKMEKLRDSTIYSYDLKLDSEIKKMGSFMMLEIPFLNVLADNSIFQDSERVYDFKFTDYETIDKYSHTIDIVLAPDLRFIELPENQLFSFNNSTYSLTFTKIGDSQINVKREYLPERKRISATDYKEFSSFVKKIIEAETTSLLYK